MKKGNNRITRINEEIKKEIAFILNNELKDPKINQMTSVIKVDTTSDLMYCKIYVSVLGDLSSQDATVEGFERSKGFIRKELAKRINLRNTPQLTFIVDQSIEYGVKMSKLIDEINKRDKE